jgi:hypothetical protein
MTPGDGYNSASISSYFDMITANGLTDWAGWTPPPAPPRFC